MWMHAGEFWISSQRIWRTPASFISAVPTLAIPCSRAFCTLSRIRRCADSKQPLRSSPLDDGEAPRLQFAGIDRCAGPLQQIAKGACRHRRDHQESLNGVARLGLKKLELRLGRDALGHDLEIKAGAERYDGPDDRRIVRVVVDIGDE